MCLRTVGVIFYKYSLNVPPDLYTRPYRAQFLKSVWGTKNSDISNIPSENWLQPLWYVASRGF